MLLIIFAIPVLIYRIAIIAFFNMPVSRKVMATCWNCVVEGGAIGLAYTGIAYGFPGAPLPFSREFRVWGSGVDFLSYNDLETYKKYCDINPGQEYRAVILKNGVPTLNHEFLDSWKKSK